MKSKGIWRVTVSVLLALMLASMTACDGGGTTVNPPPGPPAVEKTVALSESSYVLDRYESFTLTAAVKDKDGNPLTDAVVWSSEDTAVVTVTDGLVEAKGVGSATVTAKSGDAVATCVVEVEDTGARPVLDTSDETVELIVGASYTVRAAVVYKREERPDAVVTFAAVDPSIVNIDNSGKITAAKFGKTDITVTAEWRGIQSPYLTETIAVNVKEDVLVAVDRSAATVYTAKTTVDGQSFDNEVTLTGSVNINGVDGVADGGKLLWSSSDVTVATVDSNGKVTANATGKEGTTDITLSYDSGNAVYRSNPVTVTVKYPTIDKKSEIKLYVDAHEGTLKAALRAEDVFGAETDKNITRVTTVDDTTDISENATWLKQSDDGKEADRKINLNVYNDEFAYTIQATIVTKIVKTYDELIKMQEYGGGKDVTDNFTYHEWGGMFILGNDIIVPDDAATFSAKCTSGNIGSAVDVVKIVGFGGVFDGRGYTIHGLKVGHGGLFGDIKGATVKNVAITDAVIKDAQNSAGVLCYSLNGTIHNVFISYKTEVKWTGAFGRVVHGGLIRNTLIYYDLGSTAFNVHGAVTTWSYADTKLSNVAVIYADGMAEANCQVVGDKKPFKVPTTGSDKAVKEYKASDIATAGLNFSKYDFWTHVPGSLPTFVSSVKGVSIDHQTLTLAVGATEGNTLTASALNLGGTAMAYVPVVWSSSDEAVATVADGVVTAVAAGTVTITASYGTHKAVCTVTVNAA